MVKIRLKRMGSKFNAFYRIIVADAKAPRDGSFINELGYYNPYSKELKIDRELTFKWLSNGAQLTDTAKDLLTKEKILEEFTKLKSKKAKKSKPRKKSSTTKDKVKKTRESKTKVEK